MQNLLAGKARIRTERVLANPYPITSRISLVDLQDVADVAALVLATETHYGAIYELAGTDPLSQTEVAAELGQALGLQISAQEIPLFEWRKGAAGLPPYALDTLSRMFRYYAQHGLVGNASILAHLLGRAPTTLAEFARRELDS